MQVLAFAVATCRTATGTTPSRTCIGFASRLTFRTSVPAGFWFNPYALYLVLFRSHLLWQVGPFVYNLCIIFWRLLNQSFDNDLSLTKNCLPCLTQRQQYHWKLANAVSQRFGLR